MPVDRVDERFNFQMAFQTMIDSGLKKKQRQNKTFGRRNCRNNYASRLFTL